MKYETGTVTLTAGSNAVTGVGTTWLDGDWIESADIPKFFSVPELGVVYPILRVVSNTSLLLSRPMRTFPGGAPTLSAEYSIAADFSSEHNIPLPRGDDINKAALINRSLELIDVAVQNLS